MTGRPYSRAAREAAISEWMAGTPIIQVAQNHGVSKSRLSVWLQSVDKSKRAARPAVIRLCGVEHCGRQHYAHDYCRMHWMRWYKHGSPYVNLDPLHKEPADVRFWAKVDKGDECWLFNGNVNEDGYGTFRADGIVIKAHHFLGGKPPQGLEWDHLCNVRNCVRPDHLELVTHAENSRRRDERLRHKPAEGGSGGEII